MSFEVIIPFLKPIRHLLESGTISEIMVNPDSSVAERILIIEDTAELHLRKPRIVAEEAQTDTHREPVTFDDLPRAALRHRPDRIILGEIRGTEARTLLDAMNTGHRGALATIHASSAKGALLRLRTLLMRGTSSLRPEEADAEIRSSINRVIHIDRDGARRQVTEILDLDTPVRNC